MQNLKRMFFNPLSLRKNRYINTGLSTEEIHIRLRDAVHIHEPFKGLHMTYVSNGSEFKISRPQDFFTIKKELAIRGDGLITPLGKDKNEVRIRYKCTDLRYKLITTFCTVASAIILIAITYLFFKGGLKKSIQLAFVLALPIVLNYINIKIRAKAYAQVYFDLNHELTELLDPDGEFLEGEYSEDDSV